MPRSIIYCDRAPVHVHLSVGEAVDRIDKASETDSFVFFDSYLYGGQVALRINSITSVVPVKE